MSSKDICIVCAWRATCQKRFSVKGKDFHCPDFTRDVSLPVDEEEDKEGSRIPGVKGSSETKDTE